MKTFHCTHCQNLVFFENFLCLSCERQLAYLPDRGVMAALEQDGASWHAIIDGQRSADYRLCANYVSNNVCNWAVSQVTATEKMSQENDSLCISCRLTRVIPDLTLAENSAAWYRLENAKRRLIYTLLRLQLPIASKKTETDSGIAFEFLKDSVEPNGDRKRVFTGHDNGLITINIAEADDVQREQQRKQQNEPYRTLLGHFRHEIGHYYWDRLIQDSSRLSAFRNLFGDERADYAATLKNHYENGPPADWENNFISAYATMHPWEDWAESWAHFLHMSDALETATAMGLSVKPIRTDEPSLPHPPAAQHDFDNMVGEWRALTYVLNNLSRGLGLLDSYPFVLSPRVIDKLRFVSDTVVQAGANEIEH
jgi:hypothetical protein